MSFCEIKDLTLGANVRIVGVIIAKNEPHTFTSAFNGSYKSVITLTVRNSKRYFINCSVWGSEQFTKSCDSAYLIGDVISIVSPKISPKDQKSQQYGPNTTSPFQLNVNEERSPIYRESLEKHPHLIGLIAEPIKSTSIALHLVDICDGNARAQQFVDLIVAVRSVTSLKLPTKNGERSVRKVQFFDASWDSIEMTLWSREGRKRADKWIPFETILHFVDVHCDSYKDAVVLKMWGATVCTENPRHSNRVKSLRDYITTIPADLRVKWSTETNVNQSTIDLNAITDVMSIRKIQDIAANGNGNFTAIVYAIVTELHIDPTVYPPPIQRSCVHCNQYLRVTREYCSNESCAGKLCPGKNYVDRFDIRINLSDHSGSLVDCHMYDQYAASFLDFTLDQYVTLPVHAYERIRHLHLLERRVIKILVKPKSDRGPFVEIVDIDSFDVINTVHQLKSY